MTGLHDTQVHYRGAGEVGGPAPRAATGRRPAAVAEDQHGRRARRRLRALPQCRELALQYAFLLDLAGLAGLADVAGGNPSDVRACVAVRDAL